MRTNRFQAHIVHCHKTLTCYFRVTLLNGLLYIFDQPMAVIDTFSYAHGILITNALFTIVRAYETRLRPQDRSRKRPFCWKLHYITLALLVLSALALIITESFLWYEPEEGSLDKLWAFHHTVDAIYASVSLKIMLEICMIFRPSRRRYSVLQLEVCYLSCIKQ